MKKKKLSPKRRGLLQLLHDMKEEKGYEWIYLPVLDEITLEKYGLSVYDAFTITMAEKAELIEKNEHGLHRLTEAGHDALMPYLA